MPEFNKPVIFLAYANDRVDPTNYLRNLVEEVRDIRNSLNEAQRTYFVEERGNASLDDIIRVFDRYGSRLEVFHFAGHAGSYELLLEQEGVGVSPADGKGFNRFLARYERLQLVFLNGCSTWEQAEALADLGVPAVVATASAISDRAAKAFAQRFYDRLIKRDSVREAFEAAEIRVDIDVKDKRSLYWQAEEARDEFPWKLFGTQTDWRLSLLPPPPSGSLTPLMCDRDAQVEAFVDSLEELLRTPTHPPHFYFLHGPRAERHKSLVTRFKEVDIRQLTEQLFGREAGRIEFFDVPKWPSVGDLAMRQRTLKRNISKVRDLPGISGSQWKARDLLVLQRARGKAVVFQHTIYSEQWDAVNHRLLDWYMNEFWNVEVTDQLPQLLFFFNVVYPETKGNFVGRLLGLTTSEQDIREEIDVLAKKSEGRSLVLEELRAISYEEVTAWVDRFYPNELIDLPGMLFEGKKKQSLSMEDIETQLKQEVERLERRRWLGNSAGNG